MRLQAAWARALGPAGAAVLALATAGCVGSRDDGPRAARSAQPTVYVVRSGDTLSGIARNLGVDMGALASANGLAPPYVIRVGQRLQLPDASGRFVSRPVVQPLPGATPAPSPRYSPTPAPRPVQPSYPSSGGVAAGAPALAWPVDGALAGRFGQTVDGRANDGIELSALAGSAVRAAAAGTVIFAGSEPQRYGNMVLIDHGGGWVTAYGYLGRLTVTEGEAVRQRTRIAFIGTGAAARPTLHFELRRENRPVDPERYLPPRL